MPTLTDIERKTKTLSDARAELRALVEVTNQQIDDIQKAAIKDIRRLVSRNMEHHADLSAMISASVDLFESPRTHIFHGIKVGLTKGKGSVEWDDEDRVIALIEKNLPDQKDALIKTTKKPIVAAIRELSVSDLKKIGCSVEGTGDVVVIKPVDGAVDKIVKALLKGTEEEPHTI